MHICIFLLRHMVDFQQAWLSRTQALVFVPDSYEIDTIEMIESASRPFAS